MLAQATKMLLSLVVFGATGRLARLELTANAQKNRDLRMSDCE